MTETQKLSMEKSKYTSTKVRVTETTVRKEEKIIVLMRLVLELGRFSSFEEDTSSSSELEIPSMTEALALSAFLLPSKRLSL